MKSLREQLNEVQINESKQIYVLVKGEKNYGINELVAAYSNKNDAMKGMKGMEEYSKSMGGSDPDYLEVLEVNLY
jgi:hypothetical protein